MQAKLKNRLSELPKLVGFVARFAADGRFSVAMLHDLNLVLEELFVNIVEHGCGDAKGRPIAVELKRRGDDVTAVVTDHGTPFNPLERGDNVPRSPLEQRGIGGVGLHLVRALSDKMTYSRNGDTNVTTVRLRTRP